MKGIEWFGKKLKLSLRYVGPFQILERIGPVAYRIDLSSYFVEIYDVFHMPSLKKGFGWQESCFVDPGSIQLQSNLTYEELQTLIVD